MHLRKIRLYIHYLNQLTKRYYQGLWTISDRCYDILFNRVYKAALKYGIDITILNFEKVQGGVKHTEPFLSIQKVYNETDLEKWKKKFPQGSIFHKELKIDGIAIEVKYIYGHLVQITTRGNGTYGSPITHRMTTFLNLPEKIDIPEPMYIVRGEAFVCKELFKKKYSNWSVNERSFVVSVLKGSLNPEPCLKFSPYHSNIKYKTREQWYKETGKYFKIYSLDLKIDAKTDGFVYKLDDLEYIYKLDKSNYYIRGQIALKPELEGVKTYIRSINWTTGKTGNVTPIALFIPIYIDGSKIEKASLSNLSKFNDLKLSKLTEVLVTKRGGIIPYIEKIVKHSNYPIFKHPIKCKCGTTYEATKFLRCINQYCFIKKTFQCTNNITKKLLNITGISEAIIYKLKVLDEYMLFTMKEQHLVSVLGKIQGSKIYRNIQAAKNIDKNIIAVTLNIDGISLNNIKKFPFKNNLLEWLDLPFPANVKKFLKQNLKSVIRKFIVINNMRDRKIINF